MSEPAQYLTLRLDHETFGIGIQHVHEILDLCPIASLPHAPAFLLGMIDVRGVGYPVVDLRLKLGMSRAAPTPSTRIILVNVTVNGKRLGVGFVADRIFEVTGIDGDRIEPAPDVGGRWHLSAIAGIGRKGPTFVVILDLAGLMTSDAADHTVALLPSAAAA